MVRASEDSRGGADKMSDEMKTETEEMHYPYVVRGQLCIVLVEHIQEENWICRHLMARIYEIKR